MELTHKVAQKMQQRATAHEAAASAPVNVFIIWTPGLIF